MLEMVVIWTRLIVVNEVVKGVGFSIQTYTYMCVYFDLLSYYIVKNAKCTNLDGLLHTYIYAYVS